MENSDLITRKNVFTARVVKRWKRLSRKAVEALLKYILNSSGQGPKQAALSGMALKSSRSLDVMANPHDSMYDSIGDIYCFFLRPIRESV